MIMLRHWKKLIPVIAVLAWVWVAAYIGSTEYIFGWIKFPFLMTAYIGGIVVFISAAYLTWD